jgi:hypothetical protein
MLNISMYNESARKVNELTLSGVQNVAYLIRGKVSNFLLYVWNRCVCL